jgi:hypothetical protein
MAGTADQGARDFVRRATRRPEDRFKPRVPVTGSSGAGGGVLGTDSGARNAAGWITLADPLPTCTETLRGAVRVATPSGSPDDFCVCEDTTGSGAWDWVCASSSSGGAVSSVNGQTGAVVLGADDIDDTAAVNKFVGAADLAKLAGIEAGADVTDAGNVGTAIDGATAKTTPVDADTLPLIDSAASNALKKVSWANVKATLAAYFDTLYSAIGHVHADPTIVVKLDTVDYNVAAKHLDFQGNSAGGTNTTWDLATATNEVDVVLKRGSEHFNVPYGDHSHTALTASGIGDGTPVVSGGGTTIYQIPGIIIQSIGSGAAGVGTLVYNPIWLREALNVNNLVAEVVSGAAATRAMNAGLYATDSSFQPTDLLIGGQFDASTAGIKTIAAPGGQIVVPPGRYLLAREVNHATPTWRLVRASTAFLLLGTNNFLQELRLTRVFATLPDPGPAWDTIGNAVTMTAYLTFLDTSP